MDTAKAVDLRPQPRVDSARIPRASLRALGPRWGEPLMSKKKSAASRSKLASFRNARRQPVAHRKNPASQAMDMATGMAMMVGPGIGGYAVTRLGGKFGRVLLGQRLAGGRFARHFGPLGSLATLIGLWYAANKWEKARKYQEPILIGSAIALFQSLLQTYLPGLVGLIDGQPVMTAPSVAGGKTGLSGYRNGKNGRRRGVSNGIRYVSPGELESERAMDEEREDRDEANEVRSESSQVSDEVSPEDASEPLSDDVEEVREILEENESLRGLYDGVFTN